MEKLLLDISETSHTLGIGKTLTYSLIAAGQLEKVKVGKKATRITRASVERYINNLTKNSGERA